MLRIVEIFDSIQGEGLFIGTPMTFVRLAGCNLRCRWCDTKYALDIASGKEMTVDQILRRIHYPDVCITGGEPLLQHRELVTLCERLRERAMVHIETNGTILPDPLPQVDSWVISPKLTNSGMKEHLKIEVLRELCKQIPFFQLKFIIDDRRDIYEAFELCEEIRRVNPEFTVIFQPLNRNPERVGVNYNEYFKRLTEMMTTIMTLLKQYTYDVRILPQLHYLMFKGERGR